MPVAAIERRDNRRTVPTWRVRWRQAGLSGRQEELFISEQEAAQFRRLVEAGRNQWPYGWVKGEGFPGEGRLPVHGR